MIKNELHMLRKNKLLLVVLIAIILIPSIYAGIFLSSMWDPYGELGKLPVAVVNLDRHVTYNDSELSIGDQMEESLKNNNSMDFQSATKAQAQTGLKNGTYYMVITIPEDFSKNASTLTDAEPKQMVLDYQTNPGKNYISSKLSESAIKEIKNSITSEVTRTYAQAVFDQITNVGNGLQDAADGTVSLMDGEQQIIDGNAKIQTNLQKLSDGSAALASGADTLKQGIVDYTDGAGKINDGLKALQQGTESVAKGTGDLLNGSIQLYDGLAVMSDSINKSMTEENVKNMQTAEAGLLTLNDGIQQLNAAVNGDGTTSAGIDMGTMTGALAQVGTNITDAGTAAGTAAGTLVGAYAKTGNMNDLGGAAGDVMAAYKQLGAFLQSNAGSLTPEQLQAIQQVMGQLANQTNPADTGTAMGKVLAATGSVGTVGSNLQAAGGTMQQLAASDLSGSVVKLKESVTTLATASKQLLPASSAAITSLRSGMQQVQSGLNKTEAADGSSGLLEGAGKIKSGLNTLNQGVSGAGGLSEGVAQLVNGAETLNANNSALVSGAEQLGAGAGQIQDGTDQLAAGNETLGKGLTDLQTGTIQLNEALQNGADTVAETNVSDKTLDMFSQPVTLQETQITTVENNGHAMAAYMMSVGLWVGCLAFCLMYPLTKCEGKLTSGLAWWGSKAVIAYPVAVVMAVALIFLLSVANGFAPQNLIGTIAVAIFAAVAFMSVMYFFNVLLGKVGSFLMLIFMVLQLAGSAGTYPIEISGTLAQKLHPYVPFTYTVDAFRNTISGGTDISHECLFLGLLAVIFTVLTVFVFQFREKRIKAEKPILHTWLEQNGLA